MKAEIAHALLANFCNQLCSPVSGLRKPAASSKGPWKYRCTISSVIWVTFGFENLDRRLCLWRVDGNERGKKQKLEARDW